MLHDLSNNAKLRRLVPALSQPSVSPQSALGQPPGQQLAHPAVYAVG